MKILLFYFQYKPEYLNSNTNFKKLNYDKLHVTENGSYFNINYEKNNKNTTQYTVEGEYFDMESIRDIICEYDYVTYIDNKFDIYDNLKKYIDISINILNENKYINQVIFGKIDNHVMHENKIIENNNVSFPIGASNFFKISNDEWRRFELIKEIFNNKNNPYEKKKDYSNVNYVEYATHMFKNITNFRLIPSLIRSSFVNATSEDCHLKICPHYEYVYSINLEKKNFKSCYLNFDIKQKENKQENKNYENMTIVTGFLDLHINRKPKRPSQIYSYMDSSVYTLSIKQNMIIYVSEELVEHVTNVRKKLNLMNKTKIINVTINDLFMKDKSNKVFDNVKKNIVPYDNNYLLLLVNTRYNYLLDAINKNYFNTDYFAWIDFGAGHIVSIPQDINIGYTNKQKIRMAWIARFNKNQFKFNHLAMGGGVFIGHKEIMKEFIKLHNKEFELLLNSGYCINDDKLLFLLFEKYPYLFDTFFSGYEFLVKKI